ncbi:MAG: metal ABC transporter substrate-binding protein [Actinomycetota bacterium]|nr:metal ABC transporter substrate-binding protein [Actinomycetota bacterium]
MRLIALCLAGGLVLTACSSSDSSSGGSESDALLVATTVSPLTSIAANIGGDLVTIEGIVPEGTNSHTFEPAPSVAGLLSDADLILVNGLKLEDPTLALAEANKRPETEIVELGTEVLPESDYIYDFSFPEEEGKPNPHLWTDPVYAGEYATLVAEKFSELDPANAEAYQANLGAYLERTTELADALEADQASVPGGIKLVTYHDAYAYVGQRYGWEVVGAIQPSNFAEPTPSEVAALIDQIEAEEVSAVFGSEVFPSPVLEEVANETGAQYIDDLRDDDLPGEPGDPEHSFLSLMRFDYVTIIEGLGGQAPSLRSLDVTDVAPDRATYPQ